MRPPEDNCPDIGQWQEYADWQEQEIVLLKNLLKRVNAFYIQENGLHMDIREALKS